MKIFRAFILLAMLSTCFPDISGEKRRPLEIEFEACGTVNAGTGDFAPHYMSARRESFFFKKTESIFVG